MPLFPQPTVHNRVIGGCIVGVQASRILVSFIFLEVNYFIFSVLFGIQETRAVPRGGRLQQLLPAPLGLKTLCGTATWLV